jgi:polyhydroxyalkanoate synthase
MTDHSSDLPRIADPLEFGQPTIEDMQHWTGVLGRAQQMILEHVSAQATSGVEMPDLSGLLAPPPALSLNPERLADAQADFWKQSIGLWQRMLDPQAAAERSPVADRRFAAPEWRAHPLFDVLVQAYQLVSEHLLRAVDAIEGLSPKQREQLRFATRSFTEAMAPSNFIATNPQAIERLIKTRGESLLKGLQNLLSDLSRGQLTHSPPQAFAPGDTIAATPGKVIHETPLFQLIQYSPTTEQVLETPLVIFPAWINRFYILDLTPKKSFVRWAVEQGMTVFMVSWRSADESLAHLGMDDYVAAELEAVEVAREICGTPSAHTLGFCVAGTHLAAMLAVLAARGEADKVASATFLAAQVDFTDAGDLGLFVDDTQLKLTQGLTKDKGYLDGRYMAAVFNMLRSRDLIWNYVVANYLLGEDYRPFDLLHWNGHTTNLPAAWHEAYLRHLYRDNRLARRGALEVLGVPVDLGRITTPTYVQAGREDHIAPAASVWKITEHFRGPVRFVLAGSGHIAGVVNPPDANKYQHWTSEDPAASLHDFIAQAAEQKGSWWPDWRRWIGGLSDRTVPATGARVPGEGQRKAIEDAPGRYVNLP